MITKILTKNNIPMNKLASNEKQQENEKAPLLYSACFQSYDSDNTIAFNTDEILHRKQPTPISKESSLSSESLAKSFEFSKEANNNTKILSTSGRKLRKSVGCLQGFALIIGILIGSGVFISPAFVIKYTQDAGMSFVIWITCGLIALGGSLCYVELGCSIKRAGGNYVYIQEAYGNLPAFICSWTLSLLVQPTGLAIITLTLGTYSMKPFDEFITPNPWYPKLIAAVVILIIAFVNCWSVRAATRAQTFFAIMQILAVVFVVCIGIWKFSKTGRNHVFDGMFNVTRQSTFTDLGPIGAALYSGLWAFDGWSMISNITEEMSNLERNLFLSIITGIPFVIFCYILVNLSFLSALTVNQISDSQAVAVTFVQQTLGKTASLIMPIMVALCCYGAANGVLFAGGRLPLAAGREGHLPEILSMIHKKRHTPIPAVLFMSFISIAMLLPDASGLEKLISLFNVAYWMIYGLSMFAVIVLRIRQPELERPYKVWLATPILMTLISLALVIFPFFDNPINPLIAFGMVSLGIPVYFVFIYLEPKHPRVLVEARWALKRKTQKIFNLVPCKM